MILELAIAATLTTGDTSIPACQPNPDVASTQRYVTTPCAVSGQDGTVTIVRDTPSASPSVSESVTPSSSSDDNDTLIGFGVAIAIALAFLLICAMASLYEY